MNKWAKIGVVVGAGAATIATMHLVNELIFKSATSKNIGANESEEKFNWKFGDISYTVQGNGSPLLLVHDNKSGGSSYEWKRVVSALSNNYTVYTIDILGCGHSDKPKLTYTAYMYTQMLSDFVKKVIGKKTDVVVSGTSASLVIMAAYLNKNTFKNIVLVNPESIQASAVGQSKRAEFRRKMLELPIIGTMLYNICVSYRNIMDYHICTVNSSCVEELTAVSHEMSHIGKGNCKYLYASKVCNYTTAYTGKAIKDLDNCIYIISGKTEDSERIADEYISMNPAIEKVIIEAANAMPHFEEPAEFCKNLKIFLGE